jgi:hypothetical protein
MTSSAGKCASFGAKAASREARDAKTAPQDDGKREAKAKAGSNASSRSFGTENVSYRTKGKGRGKSPAFGERGLQNGTEGEDGV